MGGGLCLILLQQGAELAAALLAALDELGKQSQQVGVVPVVRGDAQGGLLALLRLVALAQRPPVGRDSRGGQQLTGPIPQPGE